MPGGLRCTLKMHERGPMADPSGLNLVVVGADAKRLQWLTHHVTSHWSDAQVAAIGAGESAALDRLVAERALDALILQANFADMKAAEALLGRLPELLRIDATLYCIVLAENGSESTAP